MELSRLSNLIRLSEFDVCHEKCAFDPLTHIYRSSRKNLFKTLISSSCSYDCLYCHNAWNRGYRSSPEEIAKAFHLLNGRGLVDGAFISNSISDPEKSMEDILITGEHIRKSFSGYLHLKIIPGASKEQIKMACELANRISLNLETPSYSLLNEYCSTKSRNDFSRTLRRALKISKRMGRSFTTQIIAGLGEKDIQILRVAEKLYRMCVKRVYYSKFMPVKRTPLEKRAPESKKRLIRLYRADALLRLYGYSSKDLEKVMDSGYLSYDDPKIAIALRKLESGDGLKTFEIPGIGMNSARLIERGANLRELKKLGFSIKRASAFINSQKRLSDFFEMR